MGDQSKVFSCSWKRLIINTLYFLSFIFYLLSFVLGLDYQNLAYVIIRLIIYNVNI